MFRAPVSLKLLCVFCLIIPNARPMDAAIQLDVKQLERSIGFFYGTDSEGKADPKKEVGTGFLLNVPSKNPGGFQIVLVTARHVFDPVWACDDTTNPSFLFFRIKTRAPGDGGSITYIRIRLVGASGQRLWFPNPDETVDVAVIPVSTEDFKPELNDVGSIRFSDLATQAELDSLEIGDQAVSAGLIPQLFAEATTNVSFFRFGTVSAIGEYELRVPCRAHAGSREARLWFIATVFIPGNSGSPVLINPGMAGVKFSQSRPMVMGLVSVSVSSMGIGGVTSAERIAQAVAAAKIPGANLLRRLREVTNPYSRRLSTDFAAEMIGRDAG